MANPATPKKRVIVLGCGYAGIYAFKSLAEYDHLEVLAIDQHPYHYIQADAYDFLANKTSITDVTLSLVSLTSDFCGRVAFLHDKVTDIDLTQRRISTEQSGVLPYDYLIIAAGCRTWFPDFIPGLKEHAHGIKTLKNAFAFKQQFEQILFDNLKEEGRCAIDGNFNIVIGGAGLSGVEIAAEMAAYAKELFEGHGFACGGAKVYLVEAATEILPGMDSFLVRKSRERLNELGVTICTGQKITAIEEHAVHLEGGQTIPMRFMIWTGGIIAAQIVRNLTGLQKNRREQLLVDEFFRVRGYEDAFVLGDAGEIPGPDGAPLPPTAQVGEFCAPIVADHIARHAKGEAMRARFITIPGLVVALGGNKAAGVIFTPFTIRISGFMAFVMKFCISRYYRLPLLSRCRRGLFKSCH